MAEIPEKPGNMRFRYNGQVLDWKKDMVKLSMSDLLLLQVRMENTKSWKKAFAKKAQGVCCEICQTNCMQSKPSLDQHIIGKKHQRSVEAIVEFRHKTIKSAAVPPGKDQLDRKTPPPPPAVKTAVEVPQVRQMESVPKKFVATTAAPPAPDIVKSALSKKEPLPKSDTALENLEIVDLSSDNESKDIDTPVKAAASITMSACKTPQSAAKPMPSVTTTRSSGTTIKPGMPFNTNSATSAIAVAINATPEVAGQSSTNQVTVFETPEVDAKKINLTLALKQIKTLKSIIHSLGITDLKLIQYRYVNTDWRNMITEVGGEFTCVLCKKSNLPNLYALKMHIVEIKHKQLFDGLRGLYHPIIAPSKLPTNNLVAITKDQLSNPMQTNLKQATNIEEETPIDFKAIEREMAKENIKFTGPMDIAQFKLKHIYLEIDELIKVEYREKSNIWYSLVCKQQNTFKCSLCKTPYLGSVKNINEHLRGRKHLNAANMLTEMYHPRFCTATDRIMTGPETSNKSTEKPFPAIDNSKQAAGKENLVLNPMAVVNTARSNSTPNKETVTPNKAPSQIQSKKIIVQTQVTKNIPVQASAGRNNAPQVQVPQHPGLQNKPQSNVPSFASKPFTTKPENDKDIEGLIGIEYVVKILRNAADQSPRFECCLCEMETDGHGMQGHLKSATHRMKYLDRHFPTCMRQFQIFRNDTSSRNMLAEILRRISVAIEKYHGRDLPFECLQDEFRTNRHGIMSKVFSFRHGSEYSGPSFVNVIDKQILEEMVKNKHTFSNLEAEPKRKPTFDAGDQVSAKRYRREDQQPVVNTSSLDVEEHKKLVDQFLRSTNRDGLLSRPRRRSRSRSRDLRHNITQRSRRSRSRSVGRRRSRSGDGWATYRRMFDHSVRDLDTDYKRFERDPETHPLYQKEWKIFWQKRSDELANDGRDPTSYDFQPEWILFWTRRMDQLYDEEVDLLKRSLRDRLKLPYHNNNLREERYHLGHSRKPVSAFSQILQTMNTETPKDTNNMPQNMNDMSQNLNISYMPMNDIQQDVQAYDMQHQQGMNPYSMQQNMPNIVQQNMMPYQMQPDMAMQQQNTNLMQDDMMMMNQMPSYQIQHNMQSFRDQNIQQQNSGNEQQSQSENRNLQQVPLSLMEIDGNRNQPMECDDHIRDNLHNRNSRNIQPPVKQSRNQRSEENTNDLTEEPIETGPLNVVSVLRLLTALEDNLGILGPRVIDLLAKALTLEKVKPNSADRALLTPENSVFLETVREKLRGQIVVGVLDASKTRAVNQAIKDVTALLNKAIENDPPAVETVDRAVFKNPTAPAAPVISSQTDAVEKRELASKLATALAAQGKTNVSSEQLEQLIAVYSLIEKKQRENNTEQKKQSLSDLLVDFLKPGIAASSSRPDSNQNVANSGTNINYSVNSNRDEDFTRYRGQSSQQQNSLQQFGTQTNLNQFGGRSNQNLSAMTSKQMSQTSLLKSSNSTSYNCNLSNFDTSLSLPSLPSLNFGRGSNLQSNLSSNQFGYNRNSFNQIDQQNNSGHNQWSSNNNSNSSTGNNRQQVNTDFDMRTSVQNTPVFTTNLGRGSQQASKNSAEMVSYPTNWIRGGQQPIRNSGGNNNSAVVSQQTPIGWQQNNNKRGNNNTKNARPQVRGRR